MATNTSLLAFSAIYIYSCSTVYANTLLKVVIGS